jgi:hypothetical protein
MKVWIEARGVTESVTCEGETIVVNLHGARMSTTGVVRKNLVQSTKCPGFGANGQNFS